MSLVVSLKEKQRSREAEKQRSREAEKQRSREAEKPERGLSGVPVPTMYGWTVYRALDSSKHLLRTKMPLIMPLLPYSAFPEELTPHVGAMTVAFQKIEDEIVTLIEFLANTPEEVVGVFLKRVPIYAQVEFVKELSKICIDDEEEISKIHDLCRKVGMVRKQRNEFIHSKNHGFNKQTGEVLQVSRGRLNIHSAKKFETLVNKMYLLINALESRRFDVEEWDRSLQYWDHPKQFLDELT